MKVMVFQLQIHDENLSALEYLRRFDTNVPCPQALDKGDEQGALYGCMLDKEKYSALEEDCSQSAIIRIYTVPIGIDVDGSLYSTDTMVSWTVDGEPTLIPKPLT
jgi:hypothetical protein